MANLKEETIRVMERFDKTPKDIQWIGTPEFKISPKSFWKLADVRYDSGFGAQEIARDLLVVGTGWWLEREEYDGSEGWAYKEAMPEPEEIRKIRKLDGGMWNTLEDIQERD